MSSKMSWHTRQLAFASSSVDLVSVGAAGVTVAWTVAVTTVTWTVAVTLVLVLMGATVTETVAVALVLVLVMVRRGRSLVVDETGAALAEAEADAEAAGATEEEPLEETARSPVLFAVTNTVDRVVSGVSKVLTMTIPGRVLTTVGLEAEAAAEEEPPEETAASPVLLAVTNTVDRVSGASRVLEETTTGP